MKNADNLDQRPEELLRRLVALRKDVYRDGSDLFQRWSKKVERESFVNSCRNLSYYIALRQRDIREIQEALVPWGLSSLGRLESKTLENIDAVIASLSKITNSDLDVKYPSHDAFHMGKYQLHQNTDQIFGTKPDNRTARIMVTLPPEASKSYKLVYQLISSGMNVARINCAHDDPKIWKAMIDNIQQAKKELHCDCKILMDIAGPKARISWLYTTLKNPKVVVGDSFLLTHKDSIQFTDGLDIILGCSIPEVIPYLQVGEPVLIDDGIIEGIVVDRVDDGVIVNVNKVKDIKGVRLRAEKGLNFPKSNIKIDIITDKDREDLDFVCENADIIGCSFVKNTEDIELIQKEISKRMSPEKARSIPIMAKIETLMGIKNLPEIIVAAAAKNPFCVMIARGDLAAESGYLRLAELQQEIMWIAEAADIPVIWATQVLENMVSTGIPTRPEVTDSAESGRAECVMLNKGEHLVETVEFLSHMLDRMEEHQYKKTSKLRALQMARDVSMTETDE